MAPHALTRRDDVARATRYRWIHVAATVCLKLFALLVVSDMERRQVAMPEPPLVYFVALLPCVAALAHVGQFVASALIGCWVAGSSASQRARWHRWTALLPSLQSQGGTLVFAVCSHVLESEGFAQLLSGQFLLICRPGSGPARNKRNEETIER